jgi:hypothetical protein
MKICFIKGVCRTRPFRPNSRGTLPSLGRLELSEFSPNQCRGDDFGRHGHKIGIVGREGIRNWPAAETAETRRGLACIPWRPGTQLDDGLGGHLKTGHTWTLQNRPTERNQNKSIYTLRQGAWANTFLEKRSWRLYTDLTWAEDTATQGCDRSADSAAGMAWGGASRPTPATFWRESDKSQGFGDRVPKFGAPAPRAALEHVAVMQQRSSMALTAATSPSSLPQSSTGGWK